MTEIASIVLFATDGQKTAEFYRAAGVDVQQELHDDGPLHWAAKLGDVHVAVYDVDGNGRAPALREAGSTFPGIYVSSLDEALATLTELGAPILEQHQVRPWGCRFIAQDPDGRAVEINERHHCEADADSGYCSAAGLPVVYDGTDGEQTAQRLPTASAPRIRLGSGATINSLAVPAATGGAFSLYRWHLSESTTGPSPHFHRTFAESFYVLAGVLSFYDGDGWEELGPGDFVHVPAGGVHAFRKSPGQTASVLMLFTPGVPRHEYFSELAKRGGFVTEEVAERFHLQHDNHFLPE